MKELCKFLLQERENLALTSDEKEQIRIQLYNLYKLIDSINV